MKSAPLATFLLASVVATSCAFENSTKLLGPTAPSETGGTAGGSSSTATNASGNSTTSTSLPVSAFAGAWGSSTIAGLPLGNCSDVKWLITAQTDSSLSGTLSASCSSGVNVAANLTGTLQNNNVIDLVADGTLTAMGLPCQVNLTGTGTRQAGDTMKIDYTGSYCLGSVTGSETLRKFPNL
jgi:hypothetical protein